MTVHHKPASSQKAFSSAPEPTMQAATPSRGLHGERAVGHGTTEACHQHGQPGRTPAQLSHQPRPRGGSGRPETQKRPLEPTASPCQDVQYSPPGAKGSPKAPSSHRQAPQVPTPRPQPARAALSGTARNHPGLGEPGHQSDRNCVLARNKQGRTVRGVSFPILAAQGSAGASSPLCLGVDSNGAARVSDGNSPTWRRMLTGCCSRFSCSLAAGLHTVDVVKLGTNA